MLNQVTQALAQDVVTVTRPAAFQISDLGTIVSGGIGAAFIIAGIIVFAYLVWGGIQWVTAGGDKANVEAARTRISNAMVGLAIVAAAWAVMQILSYVFGVELTGALNIPSFY